MAQLPSEPVRVLVQNAQTTIFTANEAGVVEFSIIGLTIAKNTTNDVNVDVFIDDGFVGSDKPYFLVKNRTIDDKGFSLPAKVIPLNTDDNIIARPTSGTGEFVVTVTIAKQD